MSNYSRADTKAQWFQDDYPGAVINPNVVVVHTTEGTGYPSYGGGASAPHYTAMPDFKNKRLIWRAHFPDERSARALRNLSGGVETNTLNCVQVELIGTCDLATHRRWGSAPHIYWPEAPDWALRDLGAFLADQHRRHGTKLQAPEFLAYPASYGASRVRMTGSQWRGFYGVCGHQHVPENTHGDPGNIPMGKALAYAKGVQPQAQPVRKARQVTFQHSSMQWSDNPAQKKADAAAVFRTGAGIITFTELSTVNNRDGLAAVVAEAGEHGYAIWARGGCAVAVRRQFGKIVDKGYVGPVIKGVAKDHEARGVTWVTVDVPRVGKLTTAVAHWITRDHEPDRHRDNDRLSDAVAELLEAKAAGSALGFFAGDTNVDDQHDRLFPGHRFTTCWDELRKYPDTHGRRTIDVIGSYDADTRVRAVSARVVPLDLHTDHRTVQAVYSIQEA